MSAAPTNAVPPPAPDQDLMTLSAALWRRKLWIIGPTVLAFFMSMMIVNMLPNRYSGEARVLLENRETVYSRPDRDTRQDPAIDPEAVASQVQIVMSKDLALKVIRDMELQKLPEFVSNRVGMVTTISMLLGLANDPRSIPIEERVLQAYYKQLLVFPQGKSRVISIEFQSEDPQLAAAVANKIAEEYLAREERAKRDTSKVTSDWLDKAIDPLMKKVMAADAKVESFRASKGLFVGSNNMSISSQQLAEMNSQLATARTQQADLTARAKLIREAVRLGRVFETSEINNNELVRRLLEQRAALKAQIAFDERTLLPGHPRMQELNSQLRDLEGQVRAAAERAARSLENDARAAGARLESLQAELNRQKKSAALSNEDEVQLKALEREAAALREQLVSYRNKFLDAAARSNETASPADGRIISRAFAQNDPAFPKRMPIVALATIGTLVVSAAMVASVHLMSRVSTSALADFGSSGGHPVPQGMPGLPVPAAPPTGGGGAGGGGGGGSRRPGLGTAIMDRFRRPDIPPEPDWTAPAEPVFARPAASAAKASPVEAPLPQKSVAPATALDHPALGQPNQVAAKLALLGTPGRAKVLALHGLNRETRIALQAMRLGRRLTQDGATVIVDLSGANPLYPRVVGEEAMGLADYLISTVELPDILHRDPRSRVHLVPAGEPLANLLSGPTARRTVQSMLGALAQAYAFVIIDAGPVGSAAEFVADMTDCIGLIVPDGGDRSYVREAIAKLEEIAGAPVLVIDDQPGRSLDAAA